MAPHTENDIVTVLIGRLEPLAGRGLADLLSANRRIRVLAHDVADAALEHIVAQHAPRVVILGELVESSLLMRLKTSGRPTPGVLIVVHDPTPLYGTLLLAAGATCMAHSASMPDVLAAVRHTAHGRSIFVGDQGNRTTTHAPVDAGLLARREIEVLGHLSRGRSNAEIALAMGIGVETVRTYVVRILRKLDAGSRQELIGVTVSSKPKARKTGPG